MVVEKAKNGSGLLALVVVVYLIAIFIILPLISPMRNLGVLEPGYIRNALLLPLLIFMILSVGVSNLLRPVSSLQVLLLLMFVQGAVVGGVKFLGEYSFRYYFSHLFQVASAYVLIKVGWLLYQRWGEVFWRRIVLCALFSALISSSITIVALGRGDIGRYYTAAYGFILISAFAVVASKKIFLLSFLGSLISNKRAVLIAVVAMFFAKTFARGVSAKINFFATFLKLFLLFFASLLLAGVCYLLVVWSGANQEHAIAKAVNISVGRFEQFFTEDSTEQSLDQLSSGRLQEINAAIETLDGVDFLIGSGAGWSVVLEGSEGGKAVQNIHFTPLSLVAVYGVPVTVIFYLMLLTKLFVGLRSRSDQWTVMERMAPLYVLGGGIHSLFAYSLFIDWMFFFFFGVMLRALSDDRKNLRGGNS